MLDEIKDIETVEDIDKAFRAVAEKMQSQGQNAKEMRANIDMLANQLRDYRKAGMFRTMADETYRGFWGSEAQAKQFGELILTAIGRKTMTEVVNSDGGLLVPDELAARIIQKLGIYGIFRRNATPIPMASSSLLVPKIDSDLVVYCPGEGAEIDDSDIGVGQVGLIPKKWCCFTTVSTELEEDSVVSIGEIVGVSIARSMAKKEDFIGFMGDGTSTYFGTKGIVGALRAVDETIANIKSLVVASGNAYAEITLGDFRKCVAALPEEAEGGAKWYMNKKFYYEVVYPLAETAGVANIFEILSNQKGRFLLGYPVEFVSCMPSTAANSQICAILGDLSLGAYLGERRQLTIAKSSEVYFKKDQIAIKGTQRVAPCVFGVGDTEEAGPIVGLITAAS